jgi:DNA-binding YbaB/EbfC family protein|tara:strand:+ start:459 stop:782 length:324 start_codon:yes stop_codon:yes gene_type:complete
MKMPGNMKNMMKQAEKMKAEMDKLQEQAGDKLVEAVSGGGMVKVTAKAKGEIISVLIDDEVIASQDKEMIQDLIQVAINDALNKGQEAIKDEMSKAAISMGIPPGLL